MCFCGLQTLTSVDLKMTFHLTKALLCEPLERIHNLHSGWKVSLHKMYHMMGGEIEFL